MSFVGLPGLVLTQVTLSRACIRCGAGDAWRCWRAVAIGTAERGDESGSCTGARSIETMVMAVAKATSGAETLAVRLRRPMFDFVCVVR